MAIGVLIEALLPGGGDTMTSGGRDATTSGGGEPPPKDAFIIIILYYTSRADKRKKITKLFTIIREKCLQALKTRTKILMTQQCHHASECCFSVYHF